MSLHIKFDAISPDLADLLALAVEVDTSKKKKVNKAPKAPGKNSPKRSSRRRKKR